VGTKPKIPVWEWTAAIAMTPVPPSTKLICFVIARHLSDAAKGWRISIEQLMQETGLSNRAVALHIKKAVGAGLLTIRREHNSAGHRVGTTYTPAFPKGRPTLLHDDESPRQSAQNDDPSLGPSDEASCGERSLSDLDDILDDDPSLGLSDERSRQDSLQEKTFPSFQRESPRRRKAIPIDRSAELGEAGLAYALAKGLTAQDAKKEFEAFKAHALKNDRRCVRWDQAWRLWVLRGIEFRAQRRGPSRASAADIAACAFSVQEDQR
jgi:hypothetical protein